MGGVTSNRSGVRVVIALLAIVFLAIGYCELADAGPVLQLQHASTGGTTDINTGRNFALAGFETRSGLGVSVGRYFVGSTSCANALSIHQKIADGRWQAHLTAYGDQDCTRAGREDYPRTAGNMGVCMTRLARIRAFAVGFGGCLWQRGDLAIHNEPANFSANDQIQLTASIVLQLGGR